MRKHFYHVTPRAHSQADIVERFLSDIEGEAAFAISEIVDHQRDITPSKRVALDDFIVSSSLRSPLGIRALADTREEGITHPRPGDPGAALSAWRRAISLKHGMTRRMALGNCAEHLYNLCKSDISDRDFAAVALTLLTHQVSSDLYTNALGIKRSALLPPPLITGDSFMWVFSIPCDGQRPEICPLFDPQAMIVMPLAPDVVLSSSFNRRPTAGSQLTLIEAAEVNSQVVRFSDRFLYAPFDDFIFADTNYTIRTWKADGQGLRKTYAGVDPT